jgi:hypothetical protein
MGWEESADDRKLTFPFPLYNEFTIDNEIYKGYKESYQI